jgi:hypothetical protein
MSTIIRKFLQTSRLFGALEYYTRPEQADIWGGAFNGQCFRQLIFIDLLRSCQFEAIVEAGTFRGSTTHFFARCAHVPIYSSEVNPRFWAYASRRLEKCGNVRLFLEDSRQLLRKLPIDKTFRVFFYLDAHWPDDLPLKGETDFIFDSFENCVVMIDDFEVPGDSGYAFDDYGPGRRLSLSSFAFHRDQRISCYFPSRPAEEESGARRGCIVLATTSMTPRIEELDTLVKSAL